MQTAHPDQVLEEHKKLLHESKKDRRRTSPLTLILLLVLFGTIFGGFFYATKNELFFNRPAKAPHNSVWDGSVAEVRAYLKNHLHDPKTYDPLLWGTVRDGVGGKVVRHAYRAKNALGATVLSEKTFLISDDGSVSVVEH